MYKHGLSRSPLHYIWMSINGRCNDRKDLRYGGRGIKICERWKSFVNFYDDMKEGFIKGLSIERINVNGDYEPSNCKWVTLYEQASNKRTTQYLTIDGKTKRLVEWSKISGIKETLIRQRLKRDGLSEKEAVFNSAKIDNKIVFDKEVGVYYESITQAARLYGLRIGSLARMLNGGVRNKTNFILV